MSAVAGMDTSPVAGDTLMSPEHDALWAAHLEPHVAELLDSLRATDDPSLPYTPHIRAVHSGSCGYAQRVPGAITNRLHDFLSRHEFHLFLPFDRQRDKFSNIREQFAVPTSLTTAISRRDKNPHPYYNGKPATLSVDFMLSLRSGGWRGVDFKEKRALQSRKARKKLDLVAAALAEAGVAHEVMTEDNINRVVVRNYRFLRIHTLPFDPPPLDPATLDKVDAPLRQLLLNGRTTIFDAAVQLSRSTGIEPSRLARSCYWLLANYRWDVDFTSNIGPDYPLKFTV